MNTEWIDRNFNGTILHGKLIDHDEDFSRWVDKTIKENEGSRCLASITMTVIKEQ